MNESLKQNVGGNGAAAKNYDFKTRVIGGSRSPLGYPTFSVSDIESVVIVAIHVSLVVICALEPECF